MDTTAAAVLSAGSSVDRGPTEDENARCETWLRAELLSHDGTAPSQAVADAAREAGFSEKQVRRARTALGVRSAKVGFDGGWTLALPDAASGD